MRDGRDGRDGRASGSGRPGHGSSGAAAGGSSGPHSNPAGQGRASQAPHASASFSNEGAPHDPPRPSTATHPEMLNISLHEHAIGFFVPPGMVLHASTCNVSQGVLIEGEFVGDLVSEAGSVVIGAAASVYGSITADRIYIEGTVGSRRGQRSELMGRAMIAAGAQARVNADMRSRAWSLHTGAQIWGSVSTIEDGLLGAKS
jgi:cytoskeletal protein CcmA (bactofilin family)